MSINSINNTNFKGVIAIVGNNEQFDKLKEKIKKTGLKENCDYLCHEATYLYVGRPAKGSSSNAVNNEHKAVPCFCKQSLATKPKSLIS